LVVHADEIRAVHRIAHRIVESKARRNRWNGHSMAGGALSLRVTRRAEVRLSGSLQPVLSQEVAIVNDVAFGQPQLSWKVDVAAPAVPRRPLVLVRVAAEARWVFRTYVVGVHRDVHMATNAFSGAFPAVELVRKPHVAARHLGRASIPHPAVAVGAGVWVVGVFVAVDAVARGGEMKRPGVARSLDALVALQAVDPFDYVCAVLEGVVLSFLLETKHFCTAADEQRQRQQNRCGNATPHRSPRHVC
jgi:hypothetical protein